MGGGKKEGRRERERRLEGRKRGSKGRLEMV